jgi:hypothetical protein
MAFLSRIEMTGWGNPSSLPGATGPSLCHRGSLRAPFYLAVELLVWRLARCCEPTRP